MSLLHSVFRTGPHTVDASNKICNGAQLRETTLAASQRHPRRLKTDSSHRTSDYGKVSMSSELELKRRLTIVPVYLPIDPRLYVDSDPHKNQHDRHQNRSHDCTFSTSCVRVNEIRHYAVWRKHGRITRPSCGIDVRWKCSGHGFRVQKSMTMYILAVKYSFQPKKKKKNRPNGLRGMGKKERQTEKERLQ